MIFNIQEQAEGMMAVVSGRLDTPSAIKAQQEIAPLLDNADKQITLDCKELEYISSSGLRLFLTIRKEASAKGGTRNRVYLPSTESSISTKRLRRCL